MNLEKAIKWWWWKCAVEVVAAVIEQEGPDGKLILIGQRKAGGRHALKWEFPGGKVEAGEEPRAALARELREELAIDAVIGPLIEAYDFRYRPESLTRLTFFRVTEYAGEITNLDFAALAWERRENLPGYDFLAGDVEFVKRLAVAAGVDLVLSSITATQSRHPERKAEDLSLPDHEPRAGSSTRARNDALRERSSRRLTAQATAPRACLQDAT